MKNAFIYLIVLLLFGQLSSYAQGGSWMWVSGSNSNKYNYGTKGVVDSANMPPGRYEPAYWADLNGNFWMFGNSDTLFNDLWEYLPRLNEWVWVNGPKTNSSPGAVYGTKGIPSKSNYPSARGWGANCWTDSIGDLWLFGGVGQDAYGTRGCLNDLWRYNIATNEWTWMGGSKTWTTVGNYGTKTVASSTNWPPGIQECKSGWTGANNCLWMYGGIINALRINDMWKYDIYTNEWTYMKGDHSAKGMKGHLGTLNVEDSLNLPAAQGISDVRWKDCDGNFYTYSSYDSTNEVWKYNPKTNNWTWVYGDTTNSDTGIYASKCSQKGNHPDSRFENTSPAFVTQSAVMWNFSGATNHRFWTLGDLWYFDPLSHSWTWVSGNTNPRDIGKYGTKGVASPSNRPYPRLGYASWVDSSNNLWVFGGARWPLKYTNDLWKFIPDTTCVHIPACIAPVTIPSLKPPSDTMICTGNIATMSTRGYTILNVSPPGLSIIDTLAHIIRFVNSTTTRFSINYLSILGKESMHFTVHILQPDTLNLYSSICTGNTYTLPKGEIVNKTGVYTDTLTNIYGCDSIIHTSLYVVPHIAQKIKASLCSDHSYTLPNGNKTSVSGVYIDTFINYLGCDSIITTSLIVNTAYHYIADTHICLGQTYILPDGKNVAVTGVYTDSLKTTFGCDSTIITTLHVLRTDTFHFKSTVCQGYTYKLPKGGIASVSGIYSDTFINHVGCDSIIVTSLYMVPIIVQNITTTICSDQTYKLPKGKTIHTAGIYNDTFLNYQGCDSIIITTLYVNPSYSQTRSANICLGQVYTLANGIKVNIPGIYTDTLPTNNGCDSIIITHLSISVLPSTYISADICQGQSYTLPNGKVVYTPDTYTDTLLTHTGCDSIVITTLDVSALSIAAFSATPSKVIIEENPALLLHDQSTDWSKLEWIYENRKIATVEDTNILFSAPGLYCFTLKTFNVAGCFDTITHCVTVIDTAFLDIPTAFTPNNDGNNDVFFPIARGAHLVIKEFRVYNRWGELLYDKPIRGWDGTYNGQAQPQDTYMYIVVVEVLSGPKAPHRVIQKGDVELIR